MKKYIILLSATIFTLLVPICQSPKTPATDDAYVSSRQTDNIALDDDVLIVKNLDGRATVYVPNSEQPYIITDIFVEMLPIYDQEILNNEGIILDENYTLNKFIEDFSN